MESTLALEKMGSGARSSDAPLWQQMSIDEFAADERSQSAAILRRGGIYWRRVRPFLFRPLLVMKTYPAASVVSPGVKLWTAFQHGVPAGEPANSFLNLLLFDDVSSYSLASLDSSKRRQVRLAAKEFTVRPVTDAEEFKEKAYPVYLEFYERTKYDYMAERRHFDCFARWTDWLYSLPKTVVLGGYQHGELAAVSTSMWVEDVVLCPAAFCSGQALKLHANSLMLHTVREAAARCPGIRLVYAGPYKYNEGRGVDAFYLERGCRIVRTPARLHINPALKLLLASLLPRQCRKLWGELDDAAGLDERFHGQIVIGGSPEPCAP
ncbi:MAG: hypothetical protein ACLQVX_24035 [Limisphaerales bacterium]